MAQKGYKNPPALGEETVYETWKQEIAIWRLVTDLEKKRQALAVTLSLTGQARAKALELNVTDLNKDDGMDRLLEALDSLFLKETVDLAYEAYSNFDSYRKSPEVKMADFVMEFEHRYNQCKKYEMALPDAVLSFKLLDTANLSPRERQLALTASTDLKFTSMKSALKRIFSSNGAGASSSSTDSDIEVKQESALLTQKGDYYHRQKFRQGRPAHFQNSTLTSPRGTNPLNRFGKRTRCAICQSTFHWAKDCPHRTDPEAVKYVQIKGEEQQEENCNLTLLARENNTANQIFMTESYGCAVIDTACSRTVCGKQWLDNYVDSLDDTEKASVTTKPSSKPFKFGDGAQVKSFQNAVIPAQIGNTSCEIDTEVVDGDLPLLLSKTSLKRAGTVLDLSEDKATMFDQPVQLQFTSSGHYCIDLRNKSDISDEISGEIPESEVLLIEDDMTSADKRKILIKLHRQFGHASADRLRKLLESAGNRDAETLKILSEVVDHCEICLKYKKQSPKPAVGLPLATEFNETVAVDLHQLEKNLWYLHIIDEFTRFSAGVIVKSKQSSIFTQKFIQHWIGIHGAPRKLYSDNGGEFNSGEVRDMCENFNIEVKTTPGMSPWSNGLMERHNQTLTNIVLKVKNERNCDWDTALSWGVMAKNSLCNIHGYSAYQLVYGKNPNLPSVLSDKLPALEGTTASDVVGKHIASLHTARRAFTQAESSERIRRALRKQIRPFTGTCTTGDKIYYKRPDSPEWKGPATVIGQDGVVVFARHGGTVVRVHHCRLRKTEQFETNYETCKHECPVESTKTPVDTDIQTPAEDVCSESDSEFQEDDSTSEPNVTRTTTTNSHETEQNHGIIPDHQGKITLKPGQTVRYQDTETGNPMSAKIISRAGKATGKNRNWYNLEYTEPGPFQGIKKSVDLSRVANLENVNTSLVDTSECDENVLMIDLSWDEAKLAELESWRKNDVFQEVTDEGQKCISTRWICTLKDTPKGSVRKARLVARGFEEIGNHHIQKDSPTCAKESLRMILAILAQNKWKPHSMDIKTAFLQGQPLERNIFLRPPKEANGTRGIVWHLKKCVYGLNDASLNWYKKVKTIMMESGATLSKVDPAVFYWTNENGDLQGVLASHVDDFIWGGGVDFEKTVIDHVRSQLHVGKEDSVAFQYIGIELSCEEEQIHLHQNNYAVNLTPIWIEKTRAQQKDSPLTISEKQTLRSKVGQLLWIAHQSRPDIIFDACQLAASLKVGQVKNILEVNRVIKRVHSERVTLKFQNLGDKQLSLVVFSDSSLGNLQDGGTQGGHFIALAGENGKFSPLCWNSKKIRRVVRSSLAGETLAMADAIDTGIFLSTLFAELTSGKPDPELLSLICVTDCKSLHDAVKSTKFVSEKRLRLEVSGVKELVERGQVKELIWSETGKQLADCLTKRGASTMMLVQALETGILPE